MEGRRASGETFLPWGDTVRGRLTYDRSGRVSLQLSRPERARFRADDLEAGTPDEIRRAFDGYHAWFGRFTVGDDGAIVVHHIEASLFPNWEGQDQTRALVLDRDTLVLRSRPLPYGGESVEFSTRWTRAAAP
jgi:lipocalin-like protein